MKASTFELIQKDIPIMARAISILLVTENQEKMQTLISKLAKESFNIDTVTDTENVLSKARKGLYDLILLNMVSLGMKGLDLCRILKKDPQTATVPIIIISGSRHEIDVVLSLEIGADDYIAEPYNVRELEARIKAVLRRTHAAMPETKILKRSGIVIDRDKCTGFSNGKKITLTAQAYKLLCFLAEQQGKVFSREQLLEAVWHRSKLVGLRTIDVHIRKLRQILEKNPSDPRYIKTLRGIGYFFDQE